MATVRVEHTEHLGQRQVQVRGRTEAGNIVVVVITPEQVGQPAMYAALSVAGDRADDNAAALAARQGRADGEEGR